METEIIVSIIGVAGVSVAALLGGVGYYLKTRAERLINKRKVLFHLLEFRHQVEISSRDPKDISDKYFDYCKSYFSKKGVGEEGNIPDNLKNAIETLLLELVSANVPKIDNSFIQSYEDSLKKLSETDPVLAFKLRGAERKTEILEAKSKYISSYNEIKKDQVPEAINRILDQKIKKAKEHQNNALLKDLERDILSTALSCSFYTWVKCLRFTSKKVEVIDFSELEPVFDEFFKMLTNDDAIKQGSPCGMGDSLASVGRTAGLKNDDLVALEQSATERMKLE